MRTRGPRIGECQEGAPGGSAPFREGDHPHPRPQVPQVLPKAQPPLPGPMPLHNAWGVPGPRPHSWYVAERARPRKPSSPGWSSKALQGQGQPHPRPVSCPHSPSAEPQPSAWSWTHGLWGLDSRTGALEPWARPTCPSPPPARDGPTDLGGSALGRGAKDRVTRVRAGPAWAQVLCTRGAPTPWGFALSSPPSLQPPWRQPLLTGCPPGPGPFCLPPSPPAGRGGLSSWLPSLPSPPTPAWVTTSPYQTRAAPSLWLPDSRHCARGSPTPHGNRQAPPCPSPWGVCPPPV